MRIGVPVVLLSGVTWYLWRLYLWPLSQRGEPTANPVYAWPALLVCLLVVLGAFWAGTTVPNTHRNRESDVPSGR